MTRIGKVQVTAALNQWWDSDLRDIFTDPKEVTIVSAIEYEGGLYLIYTYGDDEADTFGE